MKRKIIKQGHNTLTITLPSEWVKRFNLKAGKEIDLTERENGLFISTQKNGDSKRAEFNITGLDIPTIWKYFMAIYREGYTEALVKFEPNSTLENPYKFYTPHKLDSRYKKETEKRPIIEILQGFTSRFIGFEIIEHGKDFILIKEMGELTSKEFDNSLRRIFLIIQQMSEETLQAITTNNPSILNHMHDIDINLDKFHDYCIRILNRIGNKEPRKASLLQTLLFFLELIGDEFKNLSIHLIQDFPKAKFKNIEESASAIKEQLDLFYEIFYKFDTEKMERIAKIDQKRNITMKETYMKANEDEKEVLHHIRVVSRYINTLLELRIEMEF